jgi:hypothetical protein
MPSIFISYRRSDTGYLATMVADTFTSKFGENSVFLDVDSIPLGLDFREYIDQQVAKCDVVLVLIGDKWLEATNDRGARRIDEERDFVRIEIESALRRDVPVIPILAEAAEMPDASLLPASISSLTYRNATELRSGRDLRHHLERLVAGVEKLLIKPSAPVAEPQPQQPSPAPHGSANAGESETVTAEIVSRAEKVTATQPRRWLPSHLSPASAPNVEPSYVAHFRPSPKSRALSIFAMLFLCYRPTTFLAALFHALFYVGMLVATMLVLIFMFAPASQDSEHPGFVVALFANLFVAIICYGPVIVFTWMPAIFLHAWNHSAREESP